MLSVTVACVGKLKESYWREACAEYQKRLSAFCRLQIVEVAEERLPDDPSAAQIDAALDAEGQRLLSRIPAGAAVVVSPDAAVVSVLAASPQDASVSSMAKSRSFAVCFIKVPSPVL